MLTCALVIYFLHMRQSIWRYVYTEALYRSVVEKDINSGRCYKTVKKFLHESAEILCSASFFGIDLILAAVQSLKKRSTNCSNKQQLCQTHLNISSCQNSVVKKVFCVFFNFQTTSIRASLEDNGLFK